MTPPPTQHTPSGDDTATTTAAGQQGRCPVCAAGFQPVGRQRYCSDRCRKLAWKRARPHLNPDLAVPPPGRCRDSTVYACPDCAQRYLAQQWCHDCNRPCRRVGVGGLCPDCDQPVTIDDLTGQQS